MDDYLMPKTIILKSLRSGRLLVEYNAWLNIPYEVRVKAYEDSKCAGCKKVKELVGSFYSQPACKDCADENNQRLQDFRKDWDLAFEKYHGRVI